MRGVRGCQDLLDKTCMKLLGLADEIEQYNSAESGISEKGLSFRALEILCNLCIFLDFAHSWLPILRMPCISVIPNPPKEQGFTRFWEQL